MRGSAHRDGGRYSVKVVCGYEPGKLYEALFAGWANNGARVVVSPEEDDS